MNNCFVSFIPVFSDEGYIPLNKIQIFGIVLLAIALILFVILLIQAHGNRSVKRNDEPLIDKTTLFWPVIILTVCLFTSIFVIQFTHVQSGSMEPTIMTGDFTIVNKLAYVKETPQRGDIVAFNSDEYHKYLLKRVIGVPGDKIEFHDGSVYINGEKCDESAYLSSDTGTYCDKTFTVPEDSFFMMGDNREHSTDSRFFKSPYIPKSAIVGKVFYYFSF